MWLAFWSVHPQRSGSHLGPVGQCGPCVFSCWIVSSSHSVFSISGFGLLPGVSCLALLLLNKTCFGQIICTINNNARVSKMSLYLQWFGVTGRLWAGKQLSQPCSNRCVARSMVEVEAAWVLCLPLTQIAVSPFWHNHNNLQICSVPCSSGWQICF